MSNGGTESGGSDVGGTGASAGTEPVGAESGSVNGGSGGSAGAEAGTSGMAGGGGSSDCQSPIPAPGRYQVRDRLTDRCLQKGAADAQLFGVYAALLDADCSAPEAQWDMVPVPNFANFYALHNAGIDANLDVRQGLKDDGTPIVIYKPQPLANQTFGFLPRTPPYFALEPQHSMNKCVEVVRSGAQLFPCDDTNQAQDFNLVRVDCP